MGGRFDFGQSVSQTAKISFGDIPHDPLKQNVFASVLARGVVQGQIESGDCGYDAVFANFV